MLVRKEARKAPRRREQCSFRWRRQIRLQHEKFPPYHSYFIANLRMVLDVEVQPGNQTASSSAQPELWALLDGLDQTSRPTLVRGDCPWGTERAMEGAEQRSIP